MMNTVKHFFKVGALLCPYLICIDWWWRKWWWGCLAKCAMGSASPLYCGGGPCAVQWGPETICFQD